MAPSGATTTPSISSASGNENAIGNGATKSGVAGASISTQGSLLVFNLVMEFF